jgi:transcriptional regulator with XRE-family HTH domain
MGATVGENLFIGAQVAYWRPRRGRSQRVLVGMSQPYLSQIESGRRPVDRRATLIALANALQVSVADLNGQRGDPQRRLAVASIPHLREALIQREIGEVGESHLDVGEALGRRPGPRHRPGSPRRGARSRRLPR